MFDETRGGCTWAPTDPSWPARSGHAAVAFGTKILVIGGHTREDDPVDAQCEVWVLETTSREWSRLRCRGYRRAVAVTLGHTATMVEGKGGRNPRVVVFGGEDRRGRLLDDAGVLDLTKMRWIEDERTRTNKDAVRGRGSRRRRGRRRGPATWRVVSATAARMSTSLAASPGRSRRTHGRTLLPQLHDDDVAQVEPRWRRPRASDQLRRGVCWTTASGSL